MGERESRSFIISTEREREKRVDRGELRKRELHFFAVVSSPQARRTNTRTSSLEIID
jgi:hypothetical protein